MSNHGIEATEDEKLFADMQQVFDIEYDIAKREQDVFRKLKEIEERELEVTSKIKKI